MIVNLERITYCCYLVVNRLPYSGVDFLLVYKRCSFPLRLDCVPLFTIYYSGKFGKPKEEVRKSRSIVCPTNGTLTDIYKLALDFNCHETIRTWCLIFFLPRMLHQTQVVGVFCTCTNVSSVQLWYNKCS